VSATASTPVRPKELRDIRGPSAVTGDARRFWRLLWHLAKTDFRLKYHGSAFGYLWSLMSPLLLFAVLYLVFTKVIRFGGDVESFAALILLNIMLFTFFAEATSSSLVSIVVGESVIRKMEFPRLVLPLSIVLAWTFTLGLDLIVVLGFLIFLAHVPVTATWLLLPVLVLWLYVFTVGVALLLSTLFVRFRDTAQIWTVISRVMFYASPVLFPIELFPPGAKALLLLNPLAPLFTQSRVWIIDPSAPSYSQAMGGAVFWIYPTLVLVSVAALGIWAFDRNAPRVAEEI
jgi:ABC-2 type transport system permease protein